MPAHPVEQKSLLVPFNWPEAAALAPACDIVKHGQRLVVVLGPSMQDRPLQEDAWISGRKLFRRVEKFAGSHKIAVGLFHPRPAVERLKDRRVEPHGLFVERPLLGYPSLGLEVPG